MDLHDYQKRAMTTCMESSMNTAYMGFNLAGEVGELLGKIGKAIRKGQWGYMLYDGGICMRDFTTIPKEQMADIKAECGDVLWQLAGMCSVLGFDLQEVAEENLMKLASRKQRGVIDGNGDNR